MFGGNFWNVDTYSINRHLLISNLFHPLDIHQPCGKAEGEGEAGEEKQLPDYGKMQHRGSEGGNGDKNRQEDKAAEPRQRRERKSNDAPSQDELQHRNSKLRAETGDR